MKRSFITTAGFTLIEMIVSLGVFAVVVTIMVGAVLVLVSTNQQLQAEQSVMTNLSFALDTMTREMRTGYNYYCAGRPNYSSGGTDAIFDEANHESLGSLTKDCPTGRASGDNLQGVSFYEGGDSLTGAGAQRVLYFYDTTDPNHKTLMRRVGNQEAQSIVSSGLNIIDANFYVDGTTRLISGSNAVQPTITIYLEAQAVNEPDKTYYLETSVTQRTLDL